MRSLCDAMLDPALFGRTVGGPTFANLADDAPEVLQPKRERWCQEYEAITGERVVACVIHGDEGHVASDGIARRNVHAHVVVDRTDRRGRVVNSIPDRKGGTRRTTITDRKAQGRRVLDMTARITDLARGKDARETKRRHIDHHSYRAPGPVTGCGPRARSRTSRCACGTGMRRSSG